MSEKDEFDYAEANRIFTAFNAILDGKVTVASLDAVVSLAGMHLTAMAEGDRKRRRDLVKAFTRCLELRLEHAERRLDQ
jgi:hypothetical protein